MCVLEFNWGVFGVAIATAIAVATESYFAFFILLKRGIFTLHDFFSIPKFSDLKPILIQSFSLSLSTIISISKSFFSYIIKFNKLLNLINY